ncbi:MAG: hypothetical protein LBK45_03475 [Tannerellaceae bacterium]|nr:hypothetical protein [Tannerellaceae bacterium]
MMRQSGYSIGYTSPTLRTQVKGNEPGWNNAGRLTGSRSREKTNTSSF